MPANSDILAPSASDVRYVTTEWMYQVSEKIYNQREHSRRVFHYAVSILDILIMMPAESLVFKADSTNLQLVGLICVFESSSYLHSAQKVPHKPRLESLRIFIKDKFKDTLFFLVQKKVEGLKIPFGIKVAPDIYSSLIGIIHETPPVHNLALVLMDSYILDYSTQKHSPNEMTASAIAVARKLIHRDAVQQWTPTLEAATSLKMAQFKQIYDEMFYVAYLLFKDPPDNAQVNPGANSIVIGDVGSIDVIGNTDTTMDD